MAKSIPSRWLQALRITIWRRQRTATTISLDRKLLLQLCDRTQKGDIWHIEGAKGLFVLT